MFLGLGKSKIKTLTGITLIFLHWIFSVPGWTFWFLEGIQKNRGSICTKPQLLYQ